LSLLKPAIISHSFSLFGDMNAIPHRIIDFYDVVSSKQTGSNWNI
jgi:hypothetical protein